MLLCLFVVSLTSSSQAFSLLTYNVSGNGATDWSTNAPQVQAIGRQMLYLQPDIVTFNEIPFTNTYQMPGFVRAYLPGYFLATNSGTDGYLRSVIISRFPIARSQKWLDGVSLSAFGYSGTFTRDLFEAEIDLPDLARPLHVFTTHLKSGSDSASTARRAAEASAVSNFFVNAFLPAHAGNLYLLAGDLNEDVNRPPAGSQQPIALLANAMTGLRLTTPVNRFTGSDRTLSIRGSLTVRFDYILPSGALSSNIVTSEVFRTDLLDPTPPQLQKLDDKTASDHLPVLMIFQPPDDHLFKLSLVQASNQWVTLHWPTAVGRRYRVEGSTNLISWDSLVESLTATGLDFSWNVMMDRAPQFFRIRREP